MKISVITATYNSERTLRDTIESILRQDHTEYEHIIIDGGSKDKTLEIIREYQPLYQGRLKWISEKDNGIYDAMNKGIRMATGDVIGILNSDDYFTDKNILSQVNKALQDKSIDIIYGDVHYVSHQNKNKIVRYYGARSFRPWMLRIGFFPPHPAFYCRKSVYTQYGLLETDLSIAADFEMCIRLLHKHHVNNRYLPLDFVTMRTGGASHPTWKKIKGVNKEKLSSLRRNNIWSCTLILMLRYIYKAFELRNIFSSSNA